jgi:hypothetical protein
MRRDYNSDSFQKKALARIQYKNRQIDKFINWSIKKKGYLKYRELIEFEKQYK